ncbi:MAG: helix-turn-helix domain-containing protein [Marmoricola sp.]
MSTLVRRADTVAVIGQALLANAGGSGHRSIAALLGRPVSTVRGWLRRFGVRAEGLRVLFTGLFHVLDASAVAVPATGSVFADALQVLGLAAAAAARLFGHRPPWQFASSASGGLLLGPAVAANTS